MNFQKSVSAALSTIVLTASMGSANALDSDSSRVSLPDLNTSGRVSQEERAEIERKKEILFRRLYEERQLEELRSMLYEQERDSAYDSALRDMFPVSAEEIRQQRIQRDVLERAQNQPVDGPINFNMDSISLDVDAPEPVELKVAKGYSSSIMFFDEAGNPWPIEGDILGDATAFKSHPMDGKPHIAAFEIERSFAQSNALINLKGLNVPVVIRLSGNNSEIHARRSVRIPRLGPNTSSEVFTARNVSHTSPNLLPILTSNRISGGERFTLSGVPGTVWYKDGQLYIRTQAQLLSPPYSDYMKSPSGYGVYQLSPSTELLFALDGEQVPARVERASETRIENSPSIFE